MSTWYTADTHFGHARIIELCQRPFRDLDHMHGVMVERWNSAVAYDDTVWVLGDLALGDLNKSLAIFKRLNGTIKVVLGNHDRPSRSYNKRGFKPDYAAKWWQVYEDNGMEIVSSGAAIRHTLADGTEVLLSHFPFESDERHGDKHAAHLTHDDGVTPLVHGHVHGTWRTRGRQLNVGVDVNRFAPVPEEEVAYWISSRRYLADRYPDRHLADEWSPAP